MKLTKINGSEVYEPWVYTNCCTWRWEYDITSSSGRVIGIWLPEEDTIAFRLKFRI